MPKTSQKNKEPAKNPCHISDGYGGILLWHDKDDLRRHLCRNLPTSKHSDGNYYCLLHKPDKNKNIEEFQRIIDERIDEINEEFNKLEMLSETESQQAKESIKYKFPWVWFPTGIDFANKNFVGDVDFREAKFGNNASFNSATFGGVANFSRAKFADNASFYSAMFNGDAKFDDVIFDGNADFSNAIFKGEAIFRSVVLGGNALFTSSTFNGRAYFSRAIFSIGKNAHFASAVILGGTPNNIETFSGWTSFTSVTFDERVYFDSAVFGGETSFASTTFNKNTDFSRATFCKDARFFSTKIEESAEMFFNPTSFRKNVSFNGMFVKGYLNFEAGNGEFWDSDWEDEEKTKPKKVVKWTNIFEDKLNFSQIRTDKPERITFNKVRLFPSWLVNTDSRKFVFTDVKWEKHKARKAELRAELGSLETSGFEKPHNFRLLTISLRNLAENAESNNRYEEASHFRKSAFECELLEHKEKGTKDVIHRLYRELSFYGESWLRAFVWLFVIWIGFAFIYCYFGQFENSFDKSAKIDFGYSFAYSLLVMTLQKPEPRPAHWLLWGLYIFQTIFAPVQAALLALAIRRKFIR